MTNHHGDDRRRSAALPLRARHGDLGRRGHDLEPADNRLIDLREAARSPDRPRVKVDLERRIAADEPVVLELGCGTADTGDRIGIDRVDGEHVDIVADLERDGLSFLSDDSVDAIYSHHVLEHIDDLEGIIAETVRVLKPAGYHQAVVPHFSNPFYFSDPTHQRPFGLYTMTYYAANAEDLYRRSVPRHYTGALIQLQEQVMWFRSIYDSRLLRRGQRKLTTIVNRSSRTQEFYEEHLTWILPCYELRIRYGPAPR